jgi:hypothetical protein
VPAFFCATDQQLKEWFRSFNNGEAPPDLTVVEAPILYLSCGLEPPNDGQAFACYGNFEAEEVSTIEEVFEIAVRNCS